MIALSTAFKTALIGISLDGCEKTFELEANCKHSENLLLSIDKLLDEMNKSIQENDSYAVVVGPGSFTGVRIAISLVKGFLAGDENKKIVTLTSFELMAYTYINKFRPNEDFACVIDGLSGLYFVCEFDKNGIQTGKERILSHEDYQNLKVKKIGLTEESISCDEKIDLSALDLLTLAKDKFLSGKLSKLEELLPLYLRKSQAEESQTKRP